MRAPNHHTIVRHHLVPPPATTVQAAHAWTATVRPTKARPLLADTLALALCVALLAVFVWSLGANSGPEPVAVAARVAR